MKLVARLARPAILPASFAAPRLIAPRSAIFDLRADGFIIAVDVTERDDDGRMRLCRQSDSWLTIARLLDIVAPLQVTARHLVAGIQRRQRGLDLQQEEIRERNEAIRLLRPREARAARPSGLRQIQSCSRILRCRGTTSSPASVPRTRGE
ncbi:hypothetical protein [Sorangium cellulosum]|nr:hypothetical protein [Sorangium cellulosum]